MKHVYVVTVQSLNYMREKISQECYGSLKSAQHIDFTWEKISQEGYASLKCAQRFIKGRADSPV